MPNTPTRFDAVIIAVGIRIITTPVRAPRANAICERWNASARREGADRILVAGRRHLYHVLSQYVDHYDTHRPHQTLSQKTPDGSLRHGAHLSLARNAPAEREAVLVPAPAAR
jgi:transposase InsO family protein